jgi:hypothetical protein
MLFVKGTVMGGFFKGKEFMEVKDKARDDIEDRLVEEVTEGRE